MEPPSFAASPYPLRLFLIQGKGLLGAYYFSKFITFLLTAELRGG